MTGVIPTPPATSSTASDDAGSNVNRPAGAETLTAWPVISRSWRNRETWPWSSRFTVNST